MTNTTSAPKTEGMIRWEQDDDGIVILTMDDPDSSANTMNENYQKAMAAVVDRLEAERETITGVVLTSAKKSFFAGGDLLGLQDAGPEDAGTVFDHAEAIKGQLRRLETLGRPVVAAINGVAVGGGLEIALACHRRIAVDHRSVKVGLPEVTLGLLPGGGGITRLVRMLGIQPALTEWLLEGTQRSAAEAAEKGVIDQLVPTVEDLIPAARAWILEHRGDESAATKPWDARGYRIPGGSPSQPSFAKNLPAFPATLRKQLKGADMPAPKAILAAAIEGAQVDVETALRIETRYFVSLVTSPTSTAMIQAFFIDLQTLNSGRIRPAGIEPRPVRRVGVLGAGMMGAGIAYACAAAGIEVVLKDVSVEKAQHGVDYSRDLLEKRVERGRMQQDQADKVLARLSATADASDLADVDAVIEAVFEDLDLKTTVLHEIEAVTGPEVLLFSNTSTLPITDLQRTTSRPEKTIGLHFFSPVDRMKLVEIIRGEDTSEETVARAYDLVQQIRKIPIVVNDGRGFYTSRVFGTLIAEATALVEEGVDPMVVERAATQAGFPSTPLAMLDEVSLTLTQHIREAEERALATEDRERPSQPGLAVVDRMVDEFNRPGRAAGSGFYDYPEGAPKSLWPGVREHFVQGTEVPLQDIKDRYLFRMALETAACFEAGVLTDTASANIGGIFGIGFPPGTGGPATFMTNYDGGLTGFVHRADELADAYGDRFRPNAWLRDRAEKGSLL